MFGIIAVAIAVAIETGNVVKTTYLPVNCPYKIFASCSLKFFSRQVITIFMSIKFVKLKIAVPIIIGTEVFYIVFLLVSFFFFSQYIFILYERYLIRDRQSIINCLDQLLPIQTQIFSRLNQLTRVRRQTEKQLEQL